MKRAVLAFFLIVAAPVRAADVKPLAHQIVKDAEDLATAPVRWRHRQWLRFAEGTGAVLAAYAADDQIVRLVSRRQNHLLNNYLGNVTHLGGGYGVDLTALLAVAGYIRGDERMADAGVEAFESSIAAAGIVTPVIKDAVGRARPIYALGKHSFHPLNSAYQSFPSGHATNAFAIASAIATRYDDSRFVPAIAYGLATSVAVARVHDRVHFASDVIAGALIGRAIAKSIVWNHRRARVTIMLLP